MSRLDDFGEYLYKATGFKNWFREVVDFVDHKKEGFHDYFEPSHEPAEWKTSGKCVRLDVAVMCMHLMAARICFRGFGSILQQAARIASNQAKGFALGKAIKVSEAGKGATTAINAIGKLIDVLEKTNIERAKEGKIRIETIKVLRDLYFNNVLLQKVGKRKRRTRLVASRHETPLQRKPNKKWKRQN